MLKAVLFDIGWTLINLKNAREFDQAFEAEIGSERYAVVRKHFIQAHRAMIDEEQWVSTVGHEISAAPEEIQKLRRKFNWPDYEAYPDAIPALRMIKERGYKIGLVSNANPWVTEVPEKMGFSAYIDASIVSCQVGLMKPDKKIFDLALQALTCNPAEALMVGDSLRNDMAGAEAAGITGILLDRDDTETYPRKIKSLVEIERFLTSDKVLD